jgi:aminocarboxymuconate-semialdehyde decarboxylase
VRHCEGCRSRLERDGRLFREVDSNCFDLDVRLADCDAQGVTAQVLSTVPVMFSYGQREVEALDLARFLNDHIAECVAAVPGRFAGLATVPMQSPELAAGELHRSVVSLGLAGVQIGTHVEGWNLDDPALEPFWETADALGAAIFVHPWDMMAQERMPRHWLPWLVGMPAEGALAACSLLMGGVVERHPNIRFMLAHGGGSFAATLPRIEHGFAARPDLCQTRTTTPPSVLARRLWADSLVHDPALIGLLRRTYGDDRIALGTDYPFPLGEERPGAALLAAGLDAGTLQAMFWDNALAWLGPAASRRLTAAGMAPPTGDPR